MSQEKKFEFLKFAIEDAQGLIKYIDTKTAIAITIIGAFIVGIFAIIEKIVKYYSNYSIFFWILLFGFFVFLVFCIRITARIINPTTDPTKNIDMAGYLAPEVKFFLANNAYDNKIFVVKNSDKHQLIYSYKKYLDEINNASDEKLIETLSYELLKVNFIRNIKSDRFTQLVNLLIFSSILFSAFYLCYTIETNRIVDKGNPEESPKTIVNSQNLSKQKIDSFTLYIMADFFRASLIGQMNRRK